MSGLNTLGGASSPHRVRAVCASGNVCRLGVEGCEKDVTLKWLSAQRVLQTSKPVLRRGNEVAIDTGLSPIRAPIGQMIVNSPSQRSASRVLILIVDDHVIAREIVATYLR